MHPWVLIPAYNPNAWLDPILKTLVNKNLRIVLVNDGSHGEAARNLLRHRGRRGIHYLEHAKNRGKGAALKTGFQYLLKNSRGIAAGVVIADADGQHRPDDILRVVRKLQRHPSAIILSQRSFSGAVPLRSLWGNQITSIIFWLWTGRYLRDTQSGLRGIPFHQLPALCRLKNDRYDFELRSLLEMIRQKIPIETVPIRTIYLDGNRDSKFRPWVDSLKIYFVFARYCLSSLLTAAVDYLIFCLAFYVHPSIFVATAVGRGFAGVLNFELNRRRVFRSRRKHFSAGLEYVVLVACLWAVSSSLIYEAHHRLHLPVLAAKALVEASLFVVGFLVQRCWIFRRSPR